MNRTVRSVNLFEDISLSTITGQIDIDKNGILWQLSLSDGKLEFATHSLHSANTLKYYLHSIGNRNMNIFTVLKSSNNIKDNIISLEKAGVIDSKQKIVLKQKITQDAVESLYWLSKHKNELRFNSEIKPLKWQENENINPEHLLEVESLVKNVHYRWQLWQQLSPIIISPHQIPITKNVSLLEKYVSSSSAISIKVLKHLITLMGNLSIRELAIIIKQDELKLAQLLSIYIKHGVLELKPPNAPLDLLPQILQENSEKLPTNIPEIPPIKTQEIKPFQKKYSIVCIDDSPAMLEIINSYLDEQKYHLTLISEPMKSLSFLFKSNPDLIIMDISMPGINGNRLCQILKSSSVFKSIPIILISGEKNISDDILESTGARDFLAKPFEKETLINLIHKYC